MVFFRNIAERKHTEHMLDFLVHEINGRNQIVISNIEELITNIKDKKQEEQLKSDLSLLFHNANTIKEAYKLLQLTKGKTKLVHIDPVEKINEAIKSITHQFPGREVRIHTHIEGIIPNIYADGFLGDVFIILFENSIENTDSEIVEIDAHLKIDEDGKTKYVEIRIEDNSKGIPDEEKRLLFKQLDISNGNGNSHMRLGLSIVKAIMDRYSGKISVEDRIKGDPIKGCAFVISFPASKPVK
jgi:signal transduction histidine kinase